MITQFSWFLSSVSACRDDVDESFTMFHKSMASLQCGYEDVQLNFHVGRKLCHREWLFSCVSKEMLSKTFMITESFATCITREWLLSCVSTNVFS